MSNIDNGIKQPLRFYDSVLKQNFRKAWVIDGGITAGLSEHHVLLCPENAIVPFQLRRRRSPNAITTFDLYTWNSVNEQFELDYSVFTIIPAPLNNHLRIIQLETADNIVWSPQADFTTFMDCGLHYVHLSDGTNNWYSEVFSVIDADNTIGYISTYHGSNTTGNYVLGKNATPGNEIISRNKPF